MPTPSFLAAAFLGATNFRAVFEVDVGDLVPEDRLQRVILVVADQLEDPPTEIHISPRRREGVDGVGVEDDEVILDLLAPPRFEDRPGDRADPLRPGAFVQLRVPRRQDRGPDLAAELHLVGGRQRLQIEMVRPGVRLRRGRFRRRTLLDGPDFGGRDDAIRLLRGEGDGSGRGVLKGLGDRPRGAFLDLFRGIGRRDRQRSRFQEQGPVRRPFPADDPAGGRDVDEADRGGGGIFPHIFDPGVRTRDAADHLAPPSRGGAFLTASSCWSSEAKSFG